MTARIRSAAIAALWHSRLSPCAVSRACLPVGRAACTLRPIRWGRTTGQSSIRRRPVGSTPTCHLDLLLTGWGRSGAAVTTLAISTHAYGGQQSIPAEFESSFDGMREDPYDNQMGEASVDGRGCRQREMLRTVELIEMLEVPFSD